MSDDLLCCDKYASLTLYRAEYLVDDVSPYMLHFSMFITTVREQGNEEQRAYWLPLIEKWKIIGAYAQVTFAFLLALYRSD